MNKYAIFRKHQNGFFSTAEDALTFHKEIKVEKNANSLYILSIDGVFQASFYAAEYEDAVIYYANRLTQQKINSMC